MTPPNNAGLLASVTLGEASAGIRERLDRHERLWGNTWLVDPVYKSAASNWAGIRERLQRDAI